ncbi:MAG: PAS domain S-box protein, partial [Ghiorsea sp.]
MNNLSADDENSERGKETTMNLEKNNFLAKTAQYSSLVVIAISSLSLLGWLVNHERLSEALPGIASMTFNTALLLWVLAVVFQQRNYNIHAKWHHMGVMLVGAFALLSLAQDVFSFDIHLDQLLMDSFNAYAHQEHPGRMSPLSALGFIFAALAYAATCCLSSKVRHAILADFLVLLLSGIGMLGLAMAYFLQDSSSTFSHFSSISCFTALCFLLLSFSLLYLLKKSYRDIHINGLFYWGTYVMYRLSYPKKFLLISLIFSLPLAALVMDKSERVTQDIIKEELKIKGLKHISLLGGMLKEIAEHRGMKAAELNGSMRFSVTLTGKKNVIDNLLEQHKALDKQDQLWLKVGEMPQEVLSRWVDIKHSKLNAEQSWKTHTEMIALIMQHMANIGHESRLDYEANPMLHNMMRIQMVDMPSFLELSGQIRGMGAGLLAAKHIPLEAQLKLVRLISKLRLRLVDGKKSLNVALAKVDAFEEYEYEEEDAKQLEALYLAYSRETEDFLKMVEAIFLHGLKKEMATDTYFFAATKVMKEGFVYFEHANDFLGVELQHHIERLHRLQYTMKFLAILLILTLFYLFASFYRSIVSMVEALSDSALRMKRGDLDAVAAVPQFDELGKVVHSFNVMADALRKSTSHINAIVEHSVEGILTTDAQANISSFNPAAEKTFGYAAEEVLGENITILMPDALKTRHLEKFGQHSLSNPSSSVLGATLELAGLKKGGTEFVMEMSINAIELDGEVIYVAMFRDISERHALESQLRQAQKMEAVGVLTGGIAHNFNNMMMALTGRLYIAKRNIQDHEKAMQQLDLAMVTIDEAKDMVSQLLTFARKDFFVSKKEVNFPDLITTATETSRLGLKSDVEMTLSVSSCTMNVLCDGNAIQQMVMNLINNAHDALAGRQNKTIAITLEQFEFAEGM